MPFSFKQLLPTFLLLIAATLTGWLVVRTFQLPINRPASLQNPDVYVFDVKAVRTGELDGKPQERLQASLLVHYPQDDRTDITLPSIVIFNADSQPWIVTADKGQAENDLESLELIDNVKLHQPADAENQELTMTTAKIMIYPYKKYAQTQQPVLLVQPSGSASTVGLNADLNTGDINLLSQVKGQYRGAS